MALAWHHPSHTTTTTARPSCTSLLKCAGREAGALLSLINAFSSQPPPLHFLWSSSSTTKLTHSHPSHTHTRTAHARQASTFSCLRPTT
jgi:hypothetical protein